MATAIPQTDFNAWLSSYGLMTADRILRQAGIRLPTNMLIQHMKTDDSYYRKLVEPQTNLIYSKWLLEQCQTMQVYAQELHINIIFADPKGDNEVQQDMVDGIMDEVNEVKEKLIAKSHDVEQIEEAINATDGACNKFVREQGEALEALHKNNAKLVCDQLQALGLELQPDFKKRLYERLKTDTGDTTLTDKQLKQLNLKEQPSPMMCAALSLVDEEYANA